MQRRWFLEAVAADGSHVTHEIRKLPFRVGRDAGNELVVAAFGLSRRHAEISCGPDGELQVVDLGSTNGTFVNLERAIERRALRENDIVHFGNAEFRVGMYEEGTVPVAVTDDVRTLITPAGSRRSGHFVPLERQFFELLAGRGLGGAAQPIVDARTGARFAMELLGRSTHPELPGSPVRLFNMAASLGREAVLSRAFRHHGIREFARRLPGTTLFLNAHPSETFEDGFTAALALLPLGHPPLDLVIEVHETAVMEVQRMRELAARLKDFGMRFAYDDFGAGQARLNELGEVPAHFVKFDMGLLHDIHEASSGKQKVVLDLVRMVHELGSVALAEGIEKEEEAVVCREMGFELIQGFLTGRPVPLDRL